MNTKLKIYFLIIARVLVFSGWAISSEKEKNSPNCIVLSFHPEN